MQAHIRWFNLRVWCPRSAAPTLAQVRAQHAATRAHEEREEARKERAKRAREEGANWARESGREGGARSPFPRRWSCAGRTSSAAPRPPSLRHRGPRPGRHKIERREGTAYNGSANARKPVGKLLAEESGCFAKCRQIRGAVVCPPHLNDKYQASRCGKIPPTWQGTFDGRTQLHAVVRAEVRADASLDSIARHPRQRNHDTDVRRTFACVHVARPAVALAHAHAARAKT
eukprot:6190151-Pleurochrysis_carterae.AAC.1